jgi:hypothetical protein
MSIETTRPYEAWLEDSPTGLVLCIIPSPDAELPAEITDALDRRRRAILTGRCDCGAVVELPGVQKGGVTCVTFVHEEDCPAGNERLTELFDKYQLNVRIK